MSKHVGRSAPARSLAEEFRGWSDERLSRLFTLRPDLGTPLPRDSAQLASRATLRPSLVVAMDQLNVAELALLARVVAATEGYDATAEPAQDVAALRDQALAWGPPTALRPVSTVAELVRDVPAATVPPTPATSPRAQTQVDRVAAGAAYEFVRACELLLDRWGTHPVAVLKSGGLAVRDLKAAASFLHVEEPVAALVMEAALAAGLLGQDRAGDLDAAWLPTAAFDRWQDHDVAQRWLQLAQAWLGSPRLAALIGTPDAQGKKRNALAPDLAQPWVPGARADVLDVLARIAPGEVPAAGTGVGSLLALLSWLAPRRAAAREQVALAILDEAATVGLTGLGGLAGYARDGFAAEALAALLPAPVDQVLIQADLTAIAPGPLAPELGHRLVVLADVESRGGATVYRFSADSIRRGLDSGWSASEIRDFLHRASSTPVPQALDYLVDDVARRFGTLRVGAVEAFLRSDDTVALAALVHDRAAASLRLRLIAPTVAVTDVPLQVVLPRIRELGHAPALEAADGTVRLVRPDAHRARSGLTRPTAARGARHLAAAAAAVSAVRSGDRAVAARPQQTEALTPADVVRLIRDAAAAEDPVWIRLLDTHGRTIERVLRPLRVEGGQVVGWEREPAEESSHPVHRIVAARRLTG